LPLRLPDPGEEGVLTAAAYSYGDTLLKLTDVSVTLGGVPVLRDLDLEVRDVLRPGVAQGQVVGLLGPSGMGKTTLFRVMAGLEAPDRGSVRLGAKGRPVQRGMVGVVAQNYPLFEHRTVMGNLQVAGCQAGLSGDSLREKAEGLLRRFGLEPHAR